MSESVLVACVCWQYELVAELFRGEDDAAATDTKVKRGGAIVRASKETQKSSQQQRQHKKTVGSQVSVLPPCRIGF